MFLAMDLMQRERDRVLQRSARTGALGFTAASFVCVTLPGAVSATWLFWCLPLFLALAITQFLVGAGRPTIWAPLSLVLGLAITVPLGLAEPANPAVHWAVVLLLAGSLPAVSLVYTTSAGRLVLLAAVFLVVLAVTVVVTWPSGRGFEALALTVLGWVLAALVGLWVCAATPRAAQRVAAIGRAHRAERQASEREAQRRQGARLLHDTVLATLTLLAHSGVGVAPDALRQQAADDAKLLRQLRLGLGTGPAQPSTDTSPAPIVTESDIGTTLESVKQRFGRIGLQVSWHGTGQVLLRSQVLDAFLLALAECLENVRRHSGVNEAHVTITDDETTVRALVTDSGVGFSLTDVAEHKLGFKESVVGRLSEVGGSARLFSAPGSGTTVVLEVPR
jgi:signal transduction histidine kinase